jgi:hypothetical protein
VAPEIGYPAPGEELSPGRGVGKTPWNKVAKPIWHAITPNGSRPRPITPPICSLLCPQDGAGLDFGGGGPPLVPGARFGALAASLAGDSGRHRVAQPTDVKKGRFGPPF